MVKLTLVKSVFASIPIYLFPLFVAPLDVITKLQRFPKTSYGIPMKPRKTSSCGMERALYCSGKGGIGIKSLRSINKAVITNGGRFSGERLILAVINCISILLQIITITRNLKVQTVDAYVRVFTTASIVSMRTQQYGKRAFMSI